MGNEGFVKLVSAWIVSCSVSFTSLGFAWTTVASLWLEPGLDGDKGEFSRMGFASGSISLPNAGRPTPLRVLTIELLRLRLAGDCTLHRFDMLSERFIIALCTNPPRPFVGETGRSGDARPGDKGARSSDGCGSIFRASNRGVDKGTGEPKPLVETEDMLE
jgi:hypothetical protein